LGAPDCEAGDGQELVAADRRRRRSVLAVVEASLSAEFKRVQASTVPAAEKSGAQLSEARVSCLWPAGGIQDNTVNRLLLMSNSEHHLASAPMALFVKSNWNGDLQTSPTRLPA
jgi:hypothetical protein